MAIDSNADLSLVERFDYLSSLLDGAAQEAVSGLALTGGNYAEAIRGTQQIVSKHMEALLQAEPVSNPQNVKALRCLFDIINGHMRSFSSLDVDEESYGSLLCPVLISKIPAELQLIVSRKVEEKDWKLKTLMATIEEEIIARERLGPTRPPLRKGDGKLPSSATTLLSRDSTTHLPNCCYCGQQHLSACCTVITQTDARKEVLKRAGRCFSCLRKGHLSRKCKSAQRCQKCQGKHHTSICCTSQPDGISGATGTSLLQTKTPNSSSLNPDAQKFSPSDTSLYIHSDKHVLLQTASALIRNPQHPEIALKLRMVLDNGSQRSYLTQSARNSLHLSTTSKRQLAIAAFGSKRREPQPCEVVRLEVQTRLGQYTSLDVFVVPHICEPLTSQPLYQYLELYPHLGGLELADNPGKGMCEVDLLVGSDFYWDFVSGETRRGDKGPVAVETTLGWILSGPTEFIRNPGQMVSLVTTHTLSIDGKVTNKMLDATLQSFWELESLGIRPDEMGDVAIDQFANSITMKEGRYEVSLPWREGHDPLPTNYQLSRRRLTGLLRRLRRTPEILKEYDFIIRSQLKHQIVEVVPEDEENASVIHYLPHHAVVRQDKNTTKVRVVYDASSKSIGPSLNQCLHVGPKYNQKINELLFRFRSYPIALVADIEKAFLMVSINPADRDVLRFLWVENPFEEDFKVVTMRFTRVMFGVTSSPFLLNATIQHHLQLYCSSSPDLVKTLNQSLYVDDLVAGADTEDEAYSLYRDSKDVLKRGSFNLRKFVTNVSQLQRRIDEKEAPMITADSNSLCSSSIHPYEESFAQSTIPIDSVSHPGEHKVLGIQWDLERDHLFFDLAHLLEKAEMFQPTKRNVVSVI